MKYFDFSYETPEENLALDEVLLDLVEVDPKEEVLRFWEPKETFVVLGYSNDAKKEANVESCLKDEIPILRRASGGGAVVQGPGCLNYTLVLNMNSRPELRDINVTNRVIMDGIRLALLNIESRSNVSETISVQGVTDLTAGKFKISGNAQKRSRNAILFHGSFLLNFELPLIEKYLSHPTKEPDYRGKRSHSQFIQNILFQADELKLAMRNHWEADKENLVSIDPIAVSQLVEAKYGNESWVKR